jgi:hypothetical protein
MRRQVHGVGPRERPDARGRCCDPRGVCDRAKGVRGERERHHARALAHEPLESVLVERAVARPDRRVTHHQVVILRHEQPGRDVGVVVEVRHDDLVARLERAGHGVREQEVERGHVRSEGDLLRLAPGEVGGGGARPLEHEVGLHRATEGAAEVGVRRGEVLAHRLDHLGRGLRAAGAVEVRRAARERGEPLAHQARIQAGARQRPALPSGS